MKELQKTAKAFGENLPESMMSIKEGELILPKKPIDIRANLKGGDLRFKIGSSSESIGMELEFQIFHKEVYEQIQISPKRAKLSDYIQFIGIATLYGKRMLATLTIGGTSVSDIEEKLNIKLVTETKYLGLAELIFTFFIDKRNNKEGDEYGFADIKNRPATKEELQDVFYIAENRPTAPNEMKPLPDYSKKEADNV